MGFNCGAVAVGSALGQMWDRRGLGGCGRGHHPPFAPGGPEARSAEWGLSRENRVMCRFLKPGCGKQIEAGELSRQHEADGGGTSYSSTFPFAHF